MAERFESEALRCGLVPRREWFVGAPLLRRNGDAESVAAVAATVPLKRLAKPTDIGWAAAFLASEAASYVSGASLEVHGGGEPPHYLEASNANK